LVTQPEPVKFDEQVRWNPGQGAGMFGSTGWAPPDRPAGQWIEDADPYWGEVLHSARDTYGDPGIHFNTDDTAAPRQLVFGDGTALPADGAVVYHDSISGRNWLQHTDGRVAELVDGKTGAAQPVAEYRRQGNSYVPVDEHGQQVGPLTRVLPRGVDPGGTPHAGQPAELPTEEQQSGRTAETVRDLQEQLKERYTTLSAAETGSRRRC
jgi:hypothetical protein